ncbi:MAG: VWA domain-containing protein, partial [Deltaproteobacteria bacterium]|nr:VWA domain-containing protein [Deltaproteobacteria bacterium]
GQGGYGDDDEYDEDGPQKVAICFVIDTTMSMGPYIQASLDVVRRFYDGILKGGNADNTYLAFVAFRSSVKAAPATEYGTKLISDFRNANERGAIEAAISEVREAKASTHAFNEDSIAGVNEALDLNWAKYGGGIIILISDAGPLPRNDRQSASRDDPSSVKDKADAKKVRIVAMHLKTSEGGNNHRYAQNAYEGMVAAMGSRRAYIPIDIPTPEAGPSAFAEVTDELVRAHSDMARDMNRKPPDEATDPRAGESPQEQARNVGSLLGYSARLDYLGSKNKTSPPSVVRSWIPDKDLGFLDSENPRDVRTVRVAVLLTKTQVSSLSQGVKAILAGASDLMSGGSKGFFEAVLSAAAQVGRDPGEFQKNPANLAEMGLLGEYLEGLPYKSRVMTLNQEVWDAWTPVQQREFILELEAKISRYEFIDSDVTNWLKVGEETDGDWLYRVPLEALP